MTYRDPETGARPTPEASLPLFEPIEREIEKVVEAQQSLNHPAMLTKVGRDDGSVEADKGPKHIAAQSRAEQAHARKSDPPESHEAAKSVVNLGRTRDEILRILRIKGPLTDDQIWVIYGTMFERGRDIPRPSPSGLRSRRSELVSMGFVIQDGEGTTVSGRRCARWRVK